MRVTKTNHNNNNNNSSNNNNDNNDNNEAIHSTCLVSLNESRP